MNYFESKIHVSPSLTFFFFKKGYIFKTVAAYIWRKKRISKDAMAPVKAGGGGSVGPALALQEGAGGTPCFQPLPAPYSKRRSAWDFLLVVSALCSISTASKTSSKAVLLFKAFDLQANNGEKTCAALAAQLAAAGYNDLNGVHTTPTTTSKGSAGKKNRQLLSNAKSHRGQI